MTRRRLTIARLMAIIILIALGLTAFKHALRRPSHPAILFKRFALVGRIDMNRDNQDDRQELKQIIEEAGGIVEFDFPPPDVGQQSGTLSNRIDWYVTDGRVPLREVRSSNSERVVAERPDFQKRMSKLVKEARLDGIKTASGDQNWRRLMIRPGSTRRGPNSQLVGSMPGSWIGHERGIPPSPRTVGWIAMGSWCG